MNKEIKAEEYTGKQFHVAVRYNRDTDEIFSVEFIDAEKKSKEEFLNRVEECNRANKNFIYKPLEGLSPEASQAIYFLVKERKYHKDSLVDDIRELISRVDDLKDEVSETLTWIEQRIEKEEQQRIKI